MNLTEMAAYVALVTDDAERRLGPHNEPRMRTVFARESALDLWLAQPDMTVSLARRLANLVRGELARRADEAHATTHSERPVRTQGGERVERMAARAARPAAS